MMISHFVKHTLDWLQMHPQYGEFATFSFAFSESIAVIGLIIPGSVILTAIGSLIGSGILPLWTTLAMAVLGAILGDTFSYGLGYHFSDGILRMWPFRKYPELFAKGERFFKKHGGKSVFIGRFAGPLRPITPLIAGMMKMPPGRFLLATTCSGLGWAPAYMLPGIFLGAASTLLTPQMISHFAIALLLIIIGVWLLWQFVRWFSKSVYYRFERSLLFFWYRMQRKPSIQHIARIFLIMDKSAHSESQTRYYGQFHLAIYFIITAALFCFVAINVHLHDWIIAWNEPVLHFFRTLRTPSLDTMALIISGFADKWVLLPVALLVFCWLAWKSYWHEAWHWLANAILAAGGVYVIKHLVQFVRPAVNVVSRSGYSFPSGHVTLATAIVGFLAVLLARHKGRYVKRTYISYIVFVVLIALTRLYLNVHWLTDVIGGMLLGSSIVMLVSLSFRRRSADSNIPSKKLFLFFCLVTLILWAVTFFTTSSKHFREYQPARLQQQIQLQSWWQQTNTPAVKLTNRFGHPISTINVEWVASQQAIVKMLEQHHWITPIASQVHSLMKHLSGKHFDSIIPLTSPFYQDQPYAFEMIKFEDNSPPLVLQAWTSFKVTADKTPVWYVRVFYYQPKFLDLLFKHKRNKKLQTLNAFTQYLPRGHWKQIPTDNQKYKMILIK